VTNFTGVSDPYEEPEAPELRLETVGIEPDAAAALVVDRLETMGLLPLAAAR
jgi:sulfate adenylyltransferase